ncbi:MAG: zinc-binding dehydrogenase [Pseudomonadota bacterium]
MAKILAAVCRTFREPLSIEEIDIRAPEGREVEVSLAACAICASDLAFINGAWDTDLPMVFGHEAAGRITGLGPGVTGFSLGDPVIVTLIRSCSQCASCGSGRPVSCSDVPGVRPALTGPSGEPMGQGMATGAFAEKVVVDQSQIAKVPADMDLTVASLLSCGVITGIGAVVNSAGLRPGEDAVVIGAGGVGLNTVQGARIAGARRVVALDLSEAKLAAAREMGATDTVRADQGDPAAEVHEILGRGADAVFVTVGAPAVYESAIAHLAASGRLVAVGMPPAGAEIHYGPDLLAYYGQKIIGSRMGDTVLARDIPWLVDLYAQGRLELDALISKRWAFDEINAAIADTQSGSARRNVLVF